jgi:predicted deacylase
MRTCGAARVALWIGLGFAAIARADCTFENDEITNPFAAGCGDVVLEYTESDDSGHSIALGYPVPLPVDSLTPVDGFRSYASLLARAQDLAITYPHVVAHRVGDTLAGRPIWAYVVGDADDVTPAGNPEPAALINATIHAREWQGPEAAMGLLEYLAESDSDPLVRYLRAVMTIVIVPVHNVDGFLETEQYPTTVTAAREQPRGGRMRRKNLRHPTTQGAVDDLLSTIDDNFYGVDLNRNGPEGYGQLGQSSSSTTSLVYRGAAAASEPEWMALEAAADLGPRDRLRMAVDLHSFGQVYIAPMTGDATHDTLTRSLVDRMRAAAGRPYAIDTSTAGSGGFGTVADHYAYGPAVPAWTLELEPRNGGQDYGGLASHGHSGFILPDSEVARMRADVVRMFLIGLYVQAGPPSAQAATITDIATGETRYDARWQADGAGGRELVTSADKALVAGRQYRLEVRFDKPMRTRDAGGKVTQYAGQAPGPGIGSVELELPGTAAESAVIADAATTGWVTAADATGRHGDDGFVVQFTVPASGVASASRRAVLSLGIVDAAGAALDARPSTPVAWSNGRWTGYEDSRGTAGTAGGADCSFRPYVADRAEASPPAASDAPTCTAAQGPQPPPSPVPGPSASGGGGVFDAVTALVLLGLLTAQARATQRFGRRTTRVRLRRSCQASDSRSQSTQR